MRISRQETYFQYTIKAIMHYRENYQLSTAKHTVIFQKIRTFVQTIFSYVYPQKCLSCKTEGSAFCDSCRSHLPWQTDPLPEYLTTLWQYQSPSLKRALWLLKYRGKKELAHDLARSLYDKILETLAEQDQFNSGTQKYIIIPIPIHKNRKKIRGYNQSELLARELSLLNTDIFSLVTDTLVKSKETKSQVSLKNRAERLKNIRGSFSLKNEEKIKGRDILLVDDVTTTGATLLEARKILQRGGAKSVSCITLAH